MTVTYNDSIGACFTGHYGIWRHDPLMCNRRGLYSVVVMDMELAHMQGVKVMHPVCVVNDYGDLVAVPMTHGAIQ